MIRYKYLANLGIFAQVNEKSIRYMNKIKLVLDKKGIKQKWLAEQLGKSFNMVNSYVQNRTQPSIETLYKIASILDVEVDELLYSKNDIEQINNKQ